MCRANLSFRNLMSSRLHEWPLQDATLPWPWRHPFFMSTWLFSSTTYLKRNQPNISQFRFSWVPQSLDRKFPSAILIWAKWQFHVKAVFHGPSTHRVSGTIHKVHLAHFRVTLKQRNFFRNYKGSDPHWALMSGAIQKY